MNETFIIFTIIGMVFLLMSYLIRYKNMIRFINYCDETEVCDLNGFKISTSNHLFFAGVLNFIFSVLVYAKVSNTILLVAYVVMMFSFLISMLLKGKKYRVKKK
ncbi:MAG: hypothetical protein N4A47_02345 [Clostridia bacterium]|jgi:hypothetical protein|nr:hypothetical protein [Clostridia bacterium]